MADATHKRFIADDRSYFSLIKKDIHRLAQEKGFSTAKLNTIDIIVAELTSNLQKHATGGAEILLGYNDLASSGCLEMTSIDNGPGIADTKKVLADGYSSSSTLGHGLGTIRRMSDGFDLFSMPRWGTIVFSRIYKDAQPTKTSVQLNALVVAKPGETVSGDGFYIQYLPKGFRCLIADGLGHGIHANIAVKEAIRAFQDCREESPVEMLRYLHQQIKRTRGIVANIISYDASNKEWKLCGIGNIATRFIGGLATKNYLPYNGIVGHNIPTTLNDMILKQEEFNQFISCSDGIRSRWDLLKFPMIQKHDSAILCAAIYKEYARQNDDMSVIACKIM